MDLNHRPYPSPTAARTCTYKDILTVVAIPLQNLENYLEIDPPSIDNLMTLSNTLFSEEECHFLFTPTYLEEGTKCSLHHSGI